MRRGPGALLCDATASVLSNQPTRLADNEGRLRQVGLAEPALWCRMTSHGHHEDLSRVDQVAVGSERNFGLTIGVALALFGALSWYRGSAHWPWLLATSVVFAIAAVATPGMLRPLNRIWFRFGLLLARIMQPIVLGLMFYAILTPFAAIFRRFARAPLGVGPQIADSSFWIARAAGRPKDDLKNQF